MGELRKDYILDRWVIIASERAKRPHQFKKEKPPEKAGHDFFAPGNESETPEEFYRVEKDGKWQIRAFPNKFPAVRQQGEANVKTDNDFYTFADAFGMHMVLVETPDDRQLWDLEVDEIKLVLEGYLAMYEKMNPDGVKYVTVFKNHKKAAGTSIVHSHSQIIAYNHVPEFVQQKVEACKKHDGCPYCKIIENEKGSDRRCFENDSFVSFTPYASRFPMEIWLFPKRHITHLKELHVDNELDQLSAMLKDILVKLKELDAPFNWVFHVAPNGDDLHFHIEILPRLATWAGFEYNGTIINIMTPENAAKYYRGEE